MSTTPLDLDFTALINEARAPQVTATVKELNEKFFAVNNFGGQFRVCHFDQVIFPGSDGRHHIREIIAPQTPQNFYHRFRHERIPVGARESGAPILKDKANVWLDHPDRRQYERVVFLPNGDVPADQLNLWRGFAYRPQQGDCSLYLAHLLNNICQGKHGDYRWLLQWMAWQVRHPDSVGESAVVVVGDKGVGKNVFAEGFCDLWGQHGSVVTSEARVTRNFNAHLRDLCVLVADEAFFAGDPRQVDQLKSLITGATLQIESKGVDVTTVPNLLRLIIISNHDHIVHATQDERRFFVLRCGDQHRSDTNYFRAIKQQLVNGGYAAMLHHLLNEVDLGGFDVRNPPHTVELHSQMRDSLTGIEAVWFDCLSHGRLPCRMDKNRQAWLRAADLCDWAAAQKKRGWANISAHDVGYLLGCNPRGKGKGMGFLNGQPRLLGPSDRSRYFAIPSLEACRRLWNEKRFPVTWDDTDGWEDKEFTHLGF